MSEETVMAIYRWKVKSTKAARHYTKLIRVKIIILQHGTTKWISRRYVDRIHVQLNCTIKKLLNSLQREDGLPVKNSEQKADLSL